MVQIKINGGWLTLPEDFSISLEQDNPLFNDEETFSFPFEIPISPNRTLLGNVGDPFGAQTLNALDGITAELWCDGILMYRGVLEVDDEVDFDEDTLPVTFMAGNSDFNSRLEDMNAQDVPLKDTIKIGTSIPKLHCKVNYQGEVVAETDIDVEEDMLMLPDFNYTVPYPQKAYCNSWVTCTNDEGVYDTLGPSRPYSGVCFFLRYFLDCLMNYLQIAVDPTALDEVEDLNRLAFFSTRCEVEYGEEETVSSWNDTELATLRTQVGYQPKVSGWGYVYAHGWGTNGQWFDVSERVAFKDVTTLPVKRDVYATKENFPDIEVTKIFEDLANAFGLKVLYDARANNLRYVWLRNIYRSTDVRTLNVEILACTLSRAKRVPYVLTYGQDDDEDYDYDDWTNVEECESYHDILKKPITSTNKTCYVDTKTGNAYRVKVNSDDGEEPCLFEVGQYNDLSVGEGDEADQQELTLNFTPVPLSCVNGSDVVSNENSDDYSSSLQEVLHPFVDVELLATKDVSGSSEFNVYPDEEVRVPVDAGTQGTLVLPLWNNRIMMTYSYSATWDEAYDTDSNEDGSPLRAYDAGYCLGILREGGNASGVEYLANNYDDEGNDQWVETADSPGFTADSCDHFGRFYDYNGEDEGGVDQEGRISLKLHAGKEDYAVNAAYAQRGLADKFMREHLYFLGHKKTVTLTVRMSLSDLLGIDFTKWYRIGEYRGFINKLSYTLDGAGLSVVDVELYVLE